MSFPQSELDAVQAEVAAALHDAYTAGQADQYAADHPDPPPPPTQMAPFFGSSMEGNADPAPLETQCGRVLGLHRTYWNFGTAASAVAQAKADHAKGRVPWISLKPQGSDSWATQANGSYDARAKDLGVKLALLGKPVWLALGHEPEGDGNLADWVKLQDRLLPIICAAAPNVKPWIILTGYDTFHSNNAAYSLAALYPKVAKPNIALDAYNPYGDDKHPGKGWQELGAYYYDLVAPEAKSRGVDWAIAETGYTDTAAVKDKDWLNRALDDMANHKVLPGVGVSYFNSTANSGTNTWPLNSVKTPVFKAALSRSHAPLT